MNFPIQLDTCPTLQKKKRFKVSNVILHVLKIIEEKRSWVSDRHNEKSRILVTNKRKNNSKKIYKENIVD